MKNALVGRVLVSIKTVTQFPVFFLLGGGGVDVGTNGPEVLSIQNTGSPSLLVDHDRRFSNIQISGDEFVLQNLPSTSFPSRFSLGLGSSPQSSLGRVQVLGGVHVSSGLPATSPSGEQDQGYSFLSSPRTGMYLEDTGLLSVLSWGEGGVLFLSPTLRDYVVCLRCRARPALSGGW